LDISGTTSGASNIPRNTSHSGTRPDDLDNVMDAVYKAIAENPDIINRLVDALCANPRGLRGPRGPTGGPGGAGAGATEQGHWRADEVGFFFPNLHHWYGTLDIVKLRGGEVVRNNIPTCLRGAALQWYTTEVTDSEKAFLRSPSTSNPQDPIHRWKVAIRRRWDPPASVAL
jgi:hypothetical protein